MCWLRRNDQYKRQTNIRLDTIGREGDPLEIVQEV